MCTSVQGASLCSSKEEEVSHLEEDEGPWTGRQLCRIGEEIWSRLGFVKVDTSSYIYREGVHSHQNRLPGYNQALQSILSWLAVEAA